MAQPSGGRKRSKGEMPIALPLHFGALIPPVWDPCVVGEWIVGYDPPPFDKDGYSVNPLHYDFVTTPPVDWLTAILNPRQAPMAEEVRRFVVRNGAFRAWDWLPAEAITTDRKVPEEVKTEIRRAKLTAGSRVYLLRRGDFWLELQLLKSLALIAGWLPEGDSNKDILHEAEAGRQILQSLEQHRIRHRLLGSVQIEEVAAAWIPAFEVGNEQTGQQEPPQPYTKAGGSPLDSSFRNFIKATLDRVLGKPDVELKFERRAGPGFYVQADSVLGIAYLTLLKQLARGWKKCRREDCGNLFPVTDDARKSYCCQYCAHLASVRRTRATSKKRRAKKIERR